MNKLISHLVVGLTIASMFQLISCSNTEEPITIVASDFAVTIPENPVNGFVLGTIQATTNKGALAFALTPSETLPGALAINATTGQLTVGSATSFDFEARQTVTGSVVITNGSVTKTVQVTVTLTDVQEVTVTASNFTLTMAENPTANAVLGAITSTTNIGKNTFAITSQTPARAMAIDDITGQLTVSEAIKFNFELYPTITGVVTVSNSGVSATATITITLTNLVETVQKRLDDGETPKQIYDSSNALLGQLYGKNYGGGMIVSYNTSTGTGLILSPEIAGGPRDWFTARTAANGYTGGGFTNWRFPTEADLTTIGNTLTTGTGQNILPFTTEAWAALTCCGGGGARTYYIHIAVVALGNTSVATLLPVRATRNY